MRNKLLQNLFFLLLVFSSLAASVSAQNILSDVLDPFSNFDLTQVYGEGTGRALFIDALIYSIIFIAMAMIGLKDQFKGNKVLPVTIGLVLAASVSIAAQRVSFKLLEQGAAFGISFLFLYLGLIMFKMMRGQGFNWKVSIIVLYIILMVSGADDKVREFGDLGRTALGVASIAFIIAIVWLIIDWRGGGGGLTGAKQTFGNEPVERREITQEERDARRAEQDEVRERQQLSRLESLGAGANKYAQEVDGDVKTLIDALKSGKIRTPEGFEKASATIGHVHASLKSLQGTSNEFNDALLKLERFENDEYRSIQDLINKVRDQVKKEPKGARPTHAKLEAFAKNKASQAQRIIADKINVTRNTLQTHLAQIETATRDLEPAFNSAIAEIKSNRLPVAVQSLERVRRMLAGIVNATNYMRRTDIEGRIIPDIQASFKAIRMDEAALVQEFKDKA